MRLLESEGRIIRAGIDDGANNHGDNDDYGDVSLLPQLVQLLKVRLPESGGGGRVIPGTDDDDNNNSENDDVSPPTRTRPTALGEFTRI